MDRIGYLGFSNTKSNQIICIDFLNFNDVEGVYTLVPILEVILLNYV